MKELFKAFWRGVVETPKLFFSPLSSNNQEEGKVVNKDKISQPVVEMIRRIDNNDRVDLESIGWCGYYLHFINSPVDHRKFALCLEGKPAILCDWMSDIEEAAVCDSVRRFLVKIQKNKEQLDREEFSKWLGVK